MYHRIFSFLFVFFLLIGHSDSNAQRPNIVFLIADDMGYGDLSCFGQKKFQTPNFDALANEGMKLTQHYAGSTVCAPSRCVLMSGLHTGHCFVRGNKRQDPIGQLPMPADTITLAEQLQKAGYVTGAFGKWGLGPPGSEGDPLTQGFDHFYGYNCQRNAHNYYPEYLFDNEKKVQLDHKVYSHGLIMEKALEFIEEHKDESFFCFLPVTIPHAAMQIPEEDRATFRKKYHQFEDITSNYGGDWVKNPIASFPAMMTRLDRDFGKVMSLLEDLDLAENTLVIVTSDNGSHREGGHDPDFFNCSGPYRGYKRDLYEGGIRMPTIVKWPGKVAAGSESDFASAGWDWMPTLCEVAGVETPDGLDGLSILPTLTDKGIQAKHEHLYWEFHEYGGRQAIRQGDWKLIRLNVKNPKKEKLELYNLKDDPAETKNLSKAHADKVQQLMKLMHQEHKPSEEFNSLD